MVTFLLSSLSLVTSSANRSQSHPPAFLETQVQRSSSWGPPIASSPLTLSFSTEATAKFNLDFSEVSHSWMFPQVFTPVLSGGLVVLGSLCPYCYLPWGKHPFISGCGTASVFITDRATGGLVPCDTCQGCKIFVAETMGKRLHVASTFYTGHVSKKYIYFRINSINIVCQFPLLTLPPLPFKII